MIEGLLLPGMDEDSEPFFGFTAVQELRVQCCSNCSAARMPPRPMCPHCGSLESIWELLSGSGTIWSYCVPHGPLLPAYSALAPYNLIIVEIPEYPAIRFCGNLVASSNGEINELDHAGIRIGESVQVVFPEAVEGVVLPRWQRLEDGES